MNKKSQKIEQQFFDYFTKRGFERYDESPLISDDPDLLYTIAGMIPFKPYFEGQIPPHNKIVTSQRCIRTNDIERVGKTKRHLTGFTMLGHFQFGGFDRREVLKQSYELLTEVYGLDPDRFVITCHPDNEETVNAWFDVFQDVDCIHLSKDNIWESGKSGLSGYCTEIYYDLEPSYRCSRYEPFDSDGDRFLEIYNIVFIDKSNGEPLKTPCIDSGIGLERLTYILGGYEDVYQVLGDCSPIVDDHLRTCKWILSEGIKPSNTGRGYVLRQLMRRLFKTKGFKPESEVFTKEYQKYQKALERGRSKLSSMSDPTHEDLVRLYETYGIPLDISHQILNEEKNKMKKELVQQKEKLEREKNLITKQIQQNPSLLPTLQLKAQEIRKEICELKQKIKEQEALDAQRPNTPLPCVPKGNTEADNLNHPPIINPIDLNGTHHADMGLIDFDRGRKLHGTRGYVLNPGLAKLERKLINKAIDYYADNGFEEIGLPLLVNQDIAYASGHLPKFEDEMYTTQDQQILIPTAEMPLTGIHRNENLFATKKYVAHTPCFRREKIAYGKDNKGIKRVHYFNKVELYTICPCDKAKEEYQKLLTVILEFVGTLKLPHRLVELCTGDLGFAAAQTYDIEVYMPGMAEWMEIASVSNCTDFQARRANIKINNEYAYTLNGTGLAVERIIAALLENHKTLENINQILGEN